ncbi:helix-turn-helix domain-containing protein [Mechercharimyces sp. CAU 1602]|uniref:helix-turn-helix domain-containing protein n=1 Tax=Mechercharimyces sp. CAU 1602 TaxID=2973933 RepID=UPI0021633537|nr:helix-turn-helix transcriptional regulator [Mechercharimyces sp. CAU 1602]MCS1350332.1 helix-turn-helix transcriptional regulator [Mechercharimyces sp. CAU 1602]
MELFQRKQLGELIRKIRKSRDLRMEDLADNNASPATISNVERGVPHVSTDKIYYLLEEKLGVDRDELPELMLDQQEKLSVLREKLRMIEYLCQINKPERALEKLEKIDIDSEVHPYAPIFYRLKGHCYELSNDFERAERLYVESIRLSQQSEYGKLDNEVSICLSSIAFCSYSQNDIYRAIDYVDQSLQAFSLSSETPDLRYILIHDKATYLSRVGRNAEALKTLENLKESLNEIKRLDIILPIYDLFSKLSLENKLYDDAIQYVKSGIDLAQPTQQYAHIFGLWTTLGSIYLSTKQLERAEESFEMATQVEKLVNSRIISTLYSRLGALYIHQKRWDDALYAANNAQENAERHEDFPKLVESLMVLGDVYRWQGEPHRSTPIYEKALKLSQENDLLHKELQIASRLAKSWESLDQKEFNRYLRHMYDLQTKHKNFFFEGADYLEGLA